MSTKTKHTLEWCGDSPVAGAVQKGYDKILLPMANDFDIDIVLTVCHGHRNFIQEMDYDKFYIYAMVTPDIVEVEQKRITGFDIGEKFQELTGGQRDYLEIKGKVPKGVEVITDDKDKPMALLYDATLYFLNDFVHCENQISLDSSILTLKYVIDKATQTEELMRMLKAGAEEKGKRSLEQALQKQFKDRLKKENLQLKSATELYNNYMVNINESQKKIISTEAIINIVKNNINEIPKQIDKRWIATKKLANSKMYENMSFQRTYIKGITTPVFLEENGRIYKFGKFEVILGFDGVIKINSLDKFSGVSKDHPHISGGNPCWGNMNGAPQKRIAESEFDIAFVEIYAFLKHYSLEGSPYLTIDHWPTISKKEYEEIKNSSDEKASTEKEKVEVKDE